MRPGTTAVCGPPQEESGVLADDEKGGWMCKLLRSAERKHRARGRQTGAHPKHALHTPHLYTHILSLPLSHSLSLALRHTSAISPTCTEHFGMRL